MKRKLLSLLNRRSGWSYSTSSRAERFSFRCDEWTGKKLPVTLGGATAQGVMIEAGLIGGEDLIEMLPPI